MVVEGQAYRFSQQSQVVLDANGYGLIRLAPTGQKWEVTSTNVLCSSRVLESRCRIYLDQVGDAYAIDGTYSGSSGDTSDTVHYLTDGQPMFIEWSGGDVGATASVRIIGWASVMGMGFRAVH
jgi:hypothetical protein